MDRPRCILIGAPVQEGTGRLGCDMGPSAYRAAGIHDALSGLGFSVEDRGNIAPLHRHDALSPHPNAAIKNQSAVADWISALENVAFEASGSGIVIFMGGDHSLSAGTMPGIARRSALEGRELFVLWLDSHPDFHTLETSESGNLHGIPMAFACGIPGFKGYLPVFPNRLKPENICMIGLRSVDPAERETLAGTKVTVHDMRAVDEHGIAPLLRAFIARVVAANGILHVSLDVDFLDPDIAPGVGTAVPGGATFREAHLVMEMLHDANIVRSLDLVELNPFLDERGRTATLMVDLAASLFGRRILDRPSRSY